MVSINGENQCTDIPPSIQNVEFDPEATNASYIENGFKEVKVGASPGRIHMIDSHH